MPGLLQNTSSNVSNLTAFRPAHQSPQQEDAPSHAFSLENSNNPGHLRLLRMQQLVQGNAAIQPKLEIGQPNDKYEQEADAIADKVVSMPSDDGTVQTKCDACAMEEEKTAGGLQPKLAVQRVLFDEEKEVPNDMVNAKMDMQASVIEKSDEEELQMKPTVLRSGDGKLQASDSFQNRLKSAKGNGQSLPDKVQREMGHQMGADLSGVKVHTGSEAASLSKEIGAQAFTHGSDVYFNKGKYNPASRDGKHLLAHELTHTIQQGGSGVKKRSKGKPITEIKRKTSASDQRVFKKNTDGSERQTMQVAPLVNEYEKPALENEANTVANFVTDPGGRSNGQENISTGGKQNSVQELRIPMTSDIPLCGRKLTHIDIEPGRWRDMEPCLPAGVPVYRVNIVGREVSTVTTGLGRQIFNLHIGYYRDPGTGRWCGIIDDSKECLTKRCIKLGCFLTWEEIWEAIKNFLEKLLDVLGIILLVILAILIAFLLKGARLGPGGTMPSPVPIA